MAWIRGDGDELSLLYRDIAAVRAAQSAVAMAPHLPGGAVFSFGFRAPAEADCAANGYLLALPAHVPSLSKLGMPSFLTRHLWERCGTEPLMGSMASLETRRLAFDPSGPKGS